MSPAILAVFFAAATQQFNLPQDLLASLCYVESKHDVSAIHRDDGTGDSIGICQVKLQTAIWLGFRGTEKQLLDPSTNIHYAAKYLHYQLRRYHSNVKAIIAYNKGNAKGLTKTKYSDKVVKQWRRENNERRHPPCSYRSCPNQNRP